MCLAHILLIHGGHMQQSLADRPHPVHSHLEVALVALVLHILNSDIRRNLRELSDNNAGEERRRLVRLQVSHVHHERPVNHIHRSDLVVHLRTEYDAKRSLVGSVNWDVST